MSQDLEKKQQEMSAEQTEQTREGGAPARNYKSEYRADGRPHRPRINAQQHPSYSSRSRRDDTPFRPEGFGTVFQQQPQQGYRPRYNNAEGGPQRGGYQPRPQGFRPRYNHAEGEQGGYQPRQQGGYQPRQQGYQQGYRPRYNNAEGEQQGGYQPRQQGYQQQGYRPRYNNGSQYGGGYHNNPYGGGYRQRQGGYAPRMQYTQKRRIEYKEDHIDPNAPIRLNKFLANAGVCSRREADDFIMAGVVTVNGEVVKELGTKVMRTDSVKFHDQLITPEKKVYVLLNKPKDCLTTSDDPQNRKTVMELVKNACPERIYPVGRLDRNTTGVLLLTNDGELASKLTHPRFLKKKIYHVTLDKNVTAHDLHQIAEGITLEDGDIKADAVEYAHETDKSQVGIEIHSGRNRIVRRIFESLGYRVIKLDRVLFAGLTKKNVRRGDWRYLTEKEVDMLRMGAFE